ncbi:MAG: hypothetical protein HY673_17390 [Chloroflexi bacterium]|nr:hypothetical protein [Chloroflexota bacterium]
MASSHRLPPLGCGWPFAYTKHTGPDWPRGSDFCMAARCPDLSPSDASELYKLAAVGVPADITNFGGGAGLFRPGPGRLLAAWYRKSPEMEPGRGYFIQFFGLLLTEDTFLRDCRGHFLGLPCPFSSDKRFAQLDEPTPPTNLCESGSTPEMQREAEAGVLEEAKKMPEEQLAGVLSALISEKQWLVLNAPPDEAARLKAIDNLTTLLPLCVRGRMTFTTHQFSFQSPLAHLIFPAPAQALPTDIFSRYLVYDHGKKEISGSRVPPSEAAAYLARAVKLPDSKKVLQVLDGFPCLQESPPQEVWKRLGEHLLATTEFDATFKEAQPDRILAYLGKAGKAATVDARTLLLAEGIKKCLERKDAKGALSLIVYPLEVTSQGTDSSTLRQTLITCLRDVDDGLTEELVDGLTTLMTKARNGEGVQTLAEALATILARPEQQGKVAGDLRNLGEKARSYPDPVLAREFVVRLLATYFVARKDEWTPVQLGAVTSVCLDFLTGKGALDAFLTDTKDVAVLSSFRPFLESCREPADQISLDLAQDCSNAGGGTPSVRRYVAYALELQPIMLTSSPKVLEQVVAAVQSNELPKDKVVRLVTECLDSQQKDGSFQRKIGEPAYIEKLLCLAQLAESPAVVVRLLSPEFGYVGDEARSRAASTLGQIYSGRPPTGEELQSIAASLFGPSSGLTDSLQPFLAIVGKLQGTSSLGPLCSAIAEKICSVENDGLFGINRMDEAMGLIVRSLEANPALDRLLGHLWKLALGEYKGNIAPEDCVPRRAGNIARVASWFRGPAEVKSSAHSEKKAVEVGTYEWCMAVLKYKNIGAELLYRYLDGLWKAMVRRGLYDQVSWMAPIVLTQADNQKREKLHEQLLCSPFDSLSSMKDLLSKGHRKIDAEWVARYVASLGAAGKKAAGDLIQFMRKESSCDDNDTPLQRYLTILAGDLKYAYPKQSEVGEKDYESLVDGALAICVLKGFWEYAGEGKSSGSIPQPAKPVRNSISKTGKELIEWLTPPHPIIQVRRPAHCYLVEYLELFRNW